jgi:hypothetical protein
MWVHIPVVDLNDPNHIQSFVNQVNVTECNEFLEACDVMEKYQDYQVASRVI